MRREIALAAVVFCYISWGGGMVAMKFALQSFGIFQIMAARVAFPAIFYLALMNIWRREKIRTGDLKYFILLAICEPCLFFLCVTCAMRFTSASEGSVIAATLPLVTALGARLFLDERLSRAALFWLCVAMGAIIGMNLASASSGHAPDPLLGNVLMLAGMIFSAGYTLLARKLAQSYSGTLVSAFQAFAGSLVFVPLGFINQWPAHAEWQAVAGIVWLGIWIGLIVYLIYNWSLKWVQAGVAGILGNIAPIAGLALAALLLGERLGPTRLACAGIAIFATAATGRCLMRG